MTVQPKKNNKLKILKITISGVLLCFLMTGFFIVYGTVSTINFFNEASMIEVAGEEEAEVVSHISLPEQVKTIYMTSWVAGTKNIRDNLVKIVDNTEINSIIIDIKDYTGQISFMIQGDENLERYDAPINRIPDIKEFLEYLHSKNIYVIGRISVFQDPHLVEQRPDLAVKKSKDGDIWKDYKGISWLDAGSIEVWEYIIDLARYSYQIGFDEINFDYIRFPSDGDMSEIYYPFSEERIIADVDTGKAKILREFFTYLDAELSDLDLVLSADLFGMVTTNDDDLNIGQILEYALPSFDFIAPMVYPSHYPKNFIGLDNPAAYPYEVVKYSMDKAVIKAKNAGMDPKKLRPWLQDFDLGADYGPAEVRAQINATYDAGLDSWMLWSASNRYTTGALLPN
ncbi:MAG: putative glycoside hydrolase [Patescibacteria group bacterium]|nr:putative glycoside hydrolase [Patescibacteria group bacterium]